MGRVPVVFGSWDGALYWDWWMIVHALAGVVLGYVGKMFDISFVLSGIVVFVLLTAWEIYEEVAQIEEPLVNTIIDIAIGMVGFVIAYKLFPTSTLLDDAVLAGFLLLVWIGLSVWGWAAYRARIAKR